jgi:hypothetical protein
MAFQAYDHWCKLAIAPSFALALGSHLSKATTNHYLIDVCKHPNVL